MELFFIIGVVVFFIFYRKMDIRVTDLERQIQMRGGVPHVSHSEPVVPLYETVPDPQSAPLEGEIPPPQYIPHGINTPPRDPLANTFVEWLKRDVLMKLGALFLLMGVGWFLSYAFIHEWIGPAGRITLGLLTGAGVLALGVWRIKTREHQGAIFTVLGSTIVLLTVFAARARYDMFDTYSALGLMLLSIVFVAFVSLKYRRNSLALASLILAGIAPYLTASPLQSLHEHFLYLLVIVAGTLWVVYVTGWRNLTLTALVITFISASPYAVMSDKILALLWVFIFTAIFFVANIVSLIRQRGGITSETNLFTALGTAVFLVLWIFTVAPEESRSLLLVAWTLVFSVGSYLVYRSTSLRSPFYVYAGTGVALFAAATAAELDGPVLTIAFTFEIAALVLGATALRLERSVITSLCSLFVVPIVLSFGSLVASSWRYGVIHADFFNLTILTLVLLIVGLFIKEHNTVRNGDDVGTGGVLVTVSCIYAGVLFWLIMHALISDRDAATTVTLIGYTVIGIGTYYYGKMHEVKAFVTGGTFLLGFVACRLLIIDVWNMDLTGRIITFIVIGILLLSTAFMGRKNHDRSLQK